MDIQPSYCSLLRAYGNKCAGGQPTDEGNQHCLQRSDYDEEHNCFIVEGDGDKRDHGQRDLHDFSTSMRHKGSQWGRASESHSSKVGKKRVRRGRCTCDS